MNDLDSQKVGILVNEAKSLVKTLFILIIF